MAALPAHPPPEATDSVVARRKKTTKNWYDQREHQAEAKAVVVERKLWEGPLPHGSRFRGKRVALGLSALDLMGTTGKAAQLLRWEDGTRPGPWHILGPKLWERFLAYVEGQLRAGILLEDIRLNPWSGAEIYRAASVLRARAAEQVEDGVAHPLEPVADDAGDLGGGDRLAAWRRLVLRGLDLADHGGDDGE